VAPTVKVSVDFLRISPYIVAVFNGEPGFEVRFYSSFEEAIWIKDF
jgi:hypothetical protein